HLDLRPFAFFRTKLQPLRRRPELYSNVQLPSIAIDSQVQEVAAVLLAHDPLQRAVSFDCLAINCDDQIAADSDRIIRNNHAPRRPAKPGFLRRRAGVNRLNQQTAVNGEAQHLREITRDWKHTDSQYRRRDVPPFRKLVEHSLRAVNRKRKTQADISL